MTTGSEHRALPDAKDSEALKYAAQEGHSDVVKLLLDHPFDVMKVLCIIAVE